MWMKSTICIIDIQVHEISTDDIDKSLVLVKLQRVLDILMHELRNKSKTAKLWLTYIEYIVTLKLFICTKRTGDWSLHLVVVGQMLNLFAATEHFNYAKSVRLYLQWMIELPEKHP